MKMQITIICLCLSWGLWSQSPPNLENDAEALSAEGVQSITRTDCYEGEEGFCSGSFSRYNENGLETEYDDYRTETISYYQYDEVGNMVMRVQIDGLAGDTLPEDVAPPSPDTILYNFNERGDVVLIKEIMHFDGRREVNEMPATYNYEDDKLREIIEQSQRSDGTYEVLRTVLSYNEEGLHVESSTQVELYEDADLLRLIQKSAPELSIFRYDEAGHCVYEKMNYADYEQPLIIERKFDEQGRITEERVQDQFFMEWAGVDEDVERYSYDAQGRLIGLYTYLNEPCMNLRGFYQHNIEYNDKGLIEQVDVVDEAGERVFFTKYAYNFEK